MSTTASVAALAVPGEKGYRVTEVVVDDPLEHEVLVRVIAAGMCHADATVKDRWSGPSLPPIVLGHEGAGVVERVGSAVRGIAPGDKVLMTFNSCGTCASCRTGHPSYCRRFNDLNMSATGAPRPDGTSGPVPARRHAAGRRFLRPVVLRAARARQRPQRAGGRRGHRR